MLQPAFIVDLTGVRPIAAHGGLGLSGVEHPPPRFRKFAPVFGQAGGFFWPEHPVVQTPEECLKPQLLDQPSPVPASRSLVRWLRSRLLAGDDLADLPPNTKPARPADRENAVAILAELEREIVPSLCHGDASPWNILASGPGNLLLIDPRGVSGELAYDLAVIALKAAPFVDPANLAERLAEETGADRSRVQAWLTVANAARV